MRSPPEIVMLGGDQALAQRLQRAIAGGGYPLSLWPCEAPFPKQLFARPPVLTIVVADVSMEAALENLQALKARFPKTNTLFIAANATPYDVIQAFRAGAGEFLLNPFNEEELRQALQHAMEKNRPSKLQKILVSGLRSAAGLVRSNINKRRQYLENNQASLGFVSEGMQSRLCTTDTSPAEDLYTHFFGKMKITFFGRHFEAPQGPKIASVLAYLLYHYNKPIHRDVLMAKFWGNSTTESARNSLHVAFHKIRNLFRRISPSADILLHDGDTYQINPNLSVSSDVKEFTASWHKGRAVEQAQGLDAALLYYNRAAALYKGDFLENCLLEEWCESERENLKETYLLLLNRLGDYFFRKQQYTASMNVCHKILDKDPCIEETHQRLMVCYQQLGMRDKAIRQYYACEEALQRELSVKPSDYTRSLFRKISEG